MEAEEQPDVVEADQVQVEEQPDVQAWHTETVPAWLPEVVQHRQQLRRLQTAVHLPLQAAPAYPSSTAGREGRSMDTPLLRLLGSTIRPHGHPWSVRHHSR